MGWRSTPLPPDWPAIVKRIKARDPLCVMCLAIGRQTPTTDIDHIGDPSDHRDEMLRGLCAWHHGKRTSKQANAKRKRVTQRYPKETHPGFK
jgi:hypothetical protein